MVYTKTEVEKDKILRNDSDKLKNEVSEMQKSLGLDSMRPLKKQGLYRQLEDIKIESNHIREVMNYTHEREVKKREEQKKAKKKSSKEILSMILAHEERKSRQEYESRRIVFLDGGFDEYENSVRMPTGLVLLKEIIESNEKDGVVFADTHVNKLPQYHVIACGEGCDDIEEGNIVLVEVYSGTEIVSGKDKYRIVSINNVLCVMENHE